MQVEDKVKVLEEQIMILEKVSQKLDDTFVKDGELFDANSFLGCVIQDMKEHLDRISR